MYIFFFLWGRGPQIGMKALLCVSKGVCVVGVSGQRAPCRMTVPCRCVRRRCRRRTGSSQRAATRSGWRRRRWAWGYSSSACISLRNHGKPQLIRSPKKLFKLQSVKHKSRKNLYGRCWEGAYLHRLEGHTLIRQQGRNAMRDRHSRGKTRSVVSDEHQK